MSRWEEQEAPEVVEEALEVVEEAPEVAPDVDLLSGGGTSEAPSSSAEPANAEAESGFEPVTITPAKPALPRQTTANLRTLAIEDEEEAVDLDDYEEPENALSALKRYAAPLTPYAEQAYTKAQPYTDEARSRIAQEWDGDTVRPYRTMAQEKYHQAADFLRPRMAKAVEASAPYREQASEYLAQALRLTPPVVLELDKQAGAGAGIELKTSFFTGRVVVERVALSCTLLGQISAGDSILEIDGEKPNNATHASNLLRKAAGPSLKVQRGHSKVAEVVGAEASDAALVARRSWKTFAGAFVCACLLFVPGMLAEAASYNRLAQTVSKGRFQMLQERVKMRQQFARMEAATLKKLDGLNSVKAENAKAQAEYHNVSKMYDDMKKELTAEKAKLKEAREQAKGETDSAATMRKKSKELRTQFLAAKQNIETKWMAANADVKKAVAELENLAPALETERRLALGTTLRSVVKTPPTRS